VEENQVKHAENTEGTFERTSLFQIIIENNSRMYLTFCLDFQDLHLQLTKLAAVHR